tara:strand:- start:483 stop:728 length:246 start_codon:yes stop_codon:yes gene_type:complete
MRIELLEEMADCMGMNASEIIAEIRSLPREEKGKIVEFVRHMSDEEREIAEALEKGFEDIKAGRVHTQEEVRKQLESWFEK